MSKSQQRRSKGSGKQERRLVRRESQRLLKQFDEELAAECPQTRSWGKNPSDEVELLGEVAQ
jgi:hypothetical protein